MAMPNFELDKADSDFRRRSTNAFACLDTLAAAHDQFTESSHAELEDAKQFWRRDDSPPRELPDGRRRHEPSRSRDAPPPAADPPRDCFRKPFAPPSRRHPARRRGGRQRGPPDHVVHPEKWTAYSLEDVPDVSDSSNAQAAFGFLRELRARREAERAVQDGQDEKEEEEGGRILFRPKAKRSAAALEAAPRRPVKNKATERLSVRTPEDDGHAPGGKERPLLDDFDVAPKRLAVESSPEAEAGCGTFKKMKAKSKARAIRQRADSDDEET